MPDATYARQRRYERKASAEVADIGELPEVKNLDRRAACERDLLRFLTDYFPASTGLKPFSDDHKRVIDRIQRCVLDGGLFLNLFPRGFAKTTISENTAIWATIYGHRRFVPVFASDAGAAESIIGSIKLELAENDLLYEDFPEVCHAIRALEGKPQRCLSQTFQSEQTHIGWRADEVILPTIPGSAASGAILTAKGLTGASRGMKHKRPDGTQQRPDFVILDDPQTDESAGTPLQVAKRLSVIRKSILKLGGHDRKIAGVINATVIRRGDLTDQIKKLPAWQCELVKMVKKWSGVHDTLWLTDYQRLRNSYDATLIGDQQRAHNEATEFYRINREKMDAGSEVSWEHCFQEGPELSAIQHAYNALIDDGEEVFASECQNEPIEEKADDDDLRIEVNTVLSKLNRIPRATTPSHSSRLVCFIDPKKELLPWAVVAFADGFTGWVVDYGTFPDQRKSYFSMRAARRKLSDGKSDSWEASLYAGLDALTNQLAAREWDREDDTKVKIERILIDAHWGDATETVRLFCRQSAHSAILMPSFGTSTRKFAFNSQAIKPGERRGQNWSIPPGNGQHKVRHVLFDANWWKTFVSSRWKTPMGSTGCLSIFGDNQESHRMFADHQASEIPRVVETAGRRFIEWDEAKGIDNDFFDCVVGCHVAASMQGVALHDRIPALKKKIVSYAEALKTRKVWRANAR